MTLDSKWFPPSIPNNFQRLERAEMEIKIMLKTLEVLKETRTLDGFLDHWLEVLQSQANVLKAITDQLEVKK